MELNLVNSVAGLFVGVVVGMTGVGGGSLMAPIMMLIFGIAPATAVGTDLWFAGITKLFGFAVHRKKGTIDFGILRRMFLGSIPAAGLTLLWLYETGGSQVKNGMMVKTLGATLILTSIAALSRNRFHKIGQYMRGAKPVPFKAMQPTLTVVAGAILGFLVTFTSIGSGALGAVMLLYLYPRRLTPSSLVGTDITHAIPLTFLAGFGHLLMGNVNFSLLGNLLIGSIPGILIGSVVAVYAPDKVIRTAIAIVLALVGLKMLAG
ncbi:MAG TPA: sulfite exporter TauE/SafE family protein [Nevskiaceae bacterium]|nr:sulfite exporter TauE/SafE family protein [Nevskiaceae bacterium]